MIDHSRFPQYRSHKIVRAVKIRGIERQAPPQFTGALCRGSYALGTACDVCERCKWEREHGPAPYVVIPAEPGVEQFTVDAAFYQKHQPRPGGYIVVYDEGAYVSYSPAAPFENGYTRIEQ